MQRVYVSAGKTQCRFCGEDVAVNRLSVHIAQKHPRPGPADTRPSLVRKQGTRRKAASPRT
ncbi:MAG: hypothetical protein IT184_15535 [Acidobacteria bacterium]|nr:hypothetical protein [Acidobacteriota bacterium]